MGVAGRGRSHARDALHLGCGNAKLFEKLAVAVAWVGVVGERLAPQTIDGVEDGKA